MNLPPGTYREITATDTPDGRSRRLVIRQRYEAPVGDVWDACTTPERLERFFFPVTGELRVGGEFQLEGEWKASGEILRCEPPRLLTVTWKYGGAPASRVTVRLAPDRTGGTVLELDHFPVPDHAPSGPGLDPVLNDPETGNWGLGTGWEIGLISLDSYLRGARPAGEDVAPFEPTPEILTLADRCGAAWADAVAASKAHR